MSYYTIHYSRLVKSIPLPIPKKPKNIKQSFFITLTVSRTLSSQHLRHRIMSYLADLAMKNDSNKFKVPFGRQQMADYLNVNRVAMCGELSKMQKDGLIKFHKFDFEIFFGNK